MLKLHQHVHPGADAAAQHHQAATAGPGGQPGPGPPHLLPQGDWPADRGVQRPPHPVPLRQRLPQPRLASGRVRGGQRVGQDPPGHRPPELHLGRLGVHRRPRLLWPGGRRRLPHRRHPGRHPASHDCLLHEVGQERRLL